MKKMRSAAPWTVAVVLLLVGSAMGAAAMGGTPQTAMIDDFSKWIVGNFLALCGVFVAATRATQVWLKGFVAGRLAEHDGGTDVHKVASAHNHGPMTDQMNRIERLCAEMKGQMDALVKGQETAVEELAEQDHRLVNVERGLTQLCAEHHILHGRALQKRAEDGPDVDLDKLRVGR